MTEPFDSSYAPGPKSFDFDINEISITKPREKAVDFSAPYYTNPQGIIVSSTSKYAHVTSLAALRGAKIGVQIGSTSLDATNSVIKPSSQPDVFNTSNDVVAAFKIHRVDAIVVDLATAFELDQRDQAQHHRRPIHRAGRRQLGGAVGQGLQAHPLRQPGSQRAAVQRHAGGAQQALDRLGGQRARAALATSGPDAE